MVGEWDEVEAAEAAEWGEQCRREDFVKRLRSELDKCTCICGHLAKVRKIIDSE